MRRPRPWPWLALVGLALVLSTTARRAAASEADAPAGMAAAETDPRLMLAAAADNHTGLAVAEVDASADMQARLAAAALPGRNPLDLAVRLRGVSPTTPLVAPVPPARLAAGFTQNFWVLDQRTANLFQTAATLRLVTDHAYWFVEPDLDDKAPEADLERSASIFESQTYPLIHRYFGSEPMPTVDGGSHIVFLLGNVPGVAAYFSSADAYPTAINPNSNQYDMIYVNLNALRPGQPVFDSTMTHEFQHMTQFARCKSQEGWVDEGASELAMRVAGYPDSPTVAFDEHTDVQLNTWSTQPAELTRHYQAAYLFLRYVAERAGGWDALPGLLATCNRGESLFSAFLTMQPIAPDLDSLFADWTVANLVQDPSVADGRYSYAKGIARAYMTGSASNDTPFLGSVPQYAANYVELPRGAASGTFVGDASVPLLAADLDQSGVWWSNRGDSLDSRLTRRVDLSGLADATLRFRVWYDLEDQFDFVYLTASRDDGQTWQVLPGQRGVPDRATGNNYGVGWTGASGPAWVDESVDLTPLVGSSVLLRFEYVTDQAYNGQGFAVKDVQIPQLGIDEPGAVEGTWLADGWVRVDAPVPEHWNLRLVQWTAAGVTVEPVPVGPDGLAAFAVDQTASRSVLVVAPTAPRTLLLAKYSVALNGSR